MSERIQELAKSVQCERHWSEEDIENFGRLIVNECVGIVDTLPNAYQDYRDQIEDAFRRDCVAKLKEQFGIK